MPNRNYQKGRSKEQRIATKLREEGWHATRSAASKGLFDVIALKAPKDTGLEQEIVNDVPVPLGLAKLIQCKTGKSSKRAINKVKETDIKKWEGLYNVTVEIL